VGTRNHVITGADRIDIDWLEEVLRQNSSLKRGGVEAFDVDEDRGNWSEIVKIRLRYRAVSSGELPSKLLLKICKGSNSFGPSEVYYYTRDYAGLGRAPLVKCYDAVFSAEPPQYHILLADLSDTHRDNRYVEPTEPYAMALAEALGVLHAFRWGTDRLAEVDALVPTAIKLDRYFEHILPGVEMFLRYISGEVDPGWVDFIQRVYERQPGRMEERTHHHQGFALLHGDTNPTNVLSPREGSSPLYLIDRQPFDWSLTTWLGPWDIANAIVLWWDTSLRRKYEIPMLRRYHDTLLKGGVTGYSWEQLLSDYKFSVVQTLDVPTEWCLLEEGDAEDMPMNPRCMIMLHRIMQAVEDLGVDIFREM
jgi:hypothetical protein